MTCFVAEYNFSHRIDQFSFGEYTPGIINPLDGEEKIADASTSITYLLKKLQFDKVLDILLVFLPCFTEWFHITILFSDYHMFQYFIQVVPTNVKTTFSSLNTFQYAVTERVSWLIYMFSLINLQIDQNIPIILKRMVTYIFAKLVLIQLDFNFKIKGWWKKWWVSGNFFFILYVSWNLCLYIVCTSLTGQEDWPR